jgi:quercetin dioxygenase-like cupin family protein
MKRAGTSTLVLGMAAAALAQNAPQLPAYSKTLAELAAAAPTGGAGGSGNARVRVVTIPGDASRPGPYAQLLEVGAHAQIAAHHHAGERIGTVLKGTWHFGYGSTFAPSALRTLPAGSVYTEPSGAAHFAMTGDDPVIVLVTGTGPTDTVYGNPADDPARPARQATGGPNPGSSGQVAQRHRCSDRLVS